MRITHIITDLDLGGAETVLYRLIASSHKKNAKATVISLTSAGVISKKLEAIGIKTYSIGINPSLPNPLKIIVLARLLKKLKPDIIQTWMYHADFIGSLAAKISGRVPVIWGIRNSTLDKRTSKFRTRLLARINASLAKFMATAIVSNSVTAKSIHVDLGYPTDKFRIIPNGFDTDEYTPNPKSYLSLRKKLNLELSTPLIGLVGRFDPQKDHKTFINAAKILYRSHPNVHFIMAGPKINWRNEDLARHIRDLGLDANFHLLGARSDIPHIMSGMDILTSTSIYGESFPNVVGEAMACGVPCVVTDIGDSANIVEGSGTVVPVENPEAIAIAWMKYLQLSKEERSKISQAARNRILNNYSIEKMVSAYNDMYLDLANQPKL